MTQLNIRKVLFILSGLASIAILVIFGRAYRVEAAVKDGDLFGDWMIKCEKEDKKKSTCFLAQELMSKNEKDKNRNDRVALFKIGYFTGKKNGLKFMQVLPFGISLQHGSTVIIGKDKLIAPGKFTTCQPLGCYAIADLSKENIDIIVNASEAYVGIISIDGKQINIPMSTKGLKEGIAALK